MKSCVKAKSGDASATCIQQGIIIAMTKPIFPAETTHRIEAEIDRYFRDAIRRAVSISPSYEELWQTLYGLMKGGGKRFRPNMTLLAYELFGGSEPEQVLPVAVAQEFLHFSLLVHDDIIDRDEIRYGQPNVIGSYRSHYKTYLPENAEVTHFAQSAAILGGDLMMSAAYELITNSNVTAEKRRQAHRLLSGSIFDVVGGELLDTEASFVPYTNGNALRIAEMKTARYSFVVPLATGAMLADAPEKQRAVLNEFAVALGVAYQLRDDILGVFGDEKQTGKSTVSDIREGKRTLLIEHALHAMNEAQKQQFNAVFGNPEAVAGDYETARRLLDTCGARQKTEADIDTHRQMALNAASKLEVGKEGKAKLALLIDKVAG